MLCSDLFKVSIFSKMAFLSKHSALDVLRFTETEPPSSAISKILQYVNG
jgi:hypothetical protein